MFNYIAKFEIIERQRKNWMAFFVRDICAEAYELVEH